MDLLTPLLGLALLIAVLVGLAWFCLGREGELMSSLFRAPGLDWPRGVQEEDPPPGWGWSIPHEALPAPEARPVRPGTTHRAVRR